MMGSQAQPAPSGGAVISDDQKFRYRLWRDLGGYQAPLFHNAHTPHQDHRGAVLFIMYNPSTADASQDDPTIRRCINFAQAWGYGRLEVVNLFAFRAADPGVLTTAHKAGWDVVGPVNDQHVQRAIGDAALVVCAWGNAIQSWKQARARHVLGMVKHPHALGLTKGGQPRHPLYVRKHVEPRAWIRIR